MKSNFLVYQVLSTVVQFAVIVLRNLRTVVLWVLFKLINLLKVHKIEIFFGFDFEICIISLLVKILRFYKKIFLIRPLLGEIRFFRLV
jgi:hypothetical protein